LGFHTRAVVRHHADLRCGLEFFGLSLEQQAMIRRWMRRMLEKPVNSSSVVPPPTPQVEVDPALPAHFRIAVAPPQRHRGQWIGPMLLVLVIASIVGGLVAWSYWHKEWAELQHQADTFAAASAQRVQLPPGAIDLLAVHKVDAVLPEGEINKTGVVLLHIVVAADGTVIDARPENGAEVFNRAAMEAVKDWRFQPYRVDGAPVEIETTVAVEFH
jgi:TonB family protein